jgi:hypothetical protein
MPGMPDVRGVRVMAMAMLLAGVTAGGIPSLAAAAGPRNGPVMRTASSLQAAYQVRLDADARTAAPLLYAAFFGVAATSASNAWAVGQYQSGTVLRTLIVHWNGKTWSRVPSPNPAPAGDNLSGVAATSASNAWAVGEQNGHSLVLHWNGKAWRQVPSPDRGNLSAVAATSTTNAWAVAIGGPKGSQTAIEHWNGKAWQVVSSPVKVGNLLAVAATSASNAWAVGFSGNWTASHALAEHWNGKKWQVVRSPDPAGAGNLLGVTATSATNAWAVSGAAQRALGVNATVIDRWNGKAWTRVPSPNPNPGGAILMAAASTSASNVWAVGTDTDFVYSYETTIVHWNGKKWQLMTSPIQDGLLTGVTATSAANAWAVGSGDTGGLIEHWNGIRWTGISFS